MLDLDHIAAQRAKRLNQTLDAWKEAVWSPEFQKFSASLSDGEVEQVLSWCPSVEHLRALIEYLEKNGDSSLTPYPRLLSLAKSDRLTPQKWIETKLPIGLKANDVPAKKSR